MKQQEKAGGGRSIAEVFSASLGGSAVPWAETDPSWSPGEVAGVLRQPGRSARSHRFAGNSLATEVELADPASLVGMLLPQDPGRATAQEPAKDPAKEPANSSADNAAGDVPGPSGDAPDTAELLVAVGRLGSWVAAREAELVAALHDEVQAAAAALAASRPGSGQVGSGLGFTLSAEELAPLLNISGRAAHRLLGQSLTLVLDLPKTLHCLGWGMISVRQAQLIADEALFVPAEVLPGFEDQVLARGAHLTPPRLKAICHRVREKIHPESVATRKAAAARDRHVEVSPAQDGMAWLSAYLPAEQACGIEHRLSFTARALQNPSESRTLTQLKADMFSDLLTHHCPPTESTHRDDPEAGTAGATGAAGGGGLVDLASVKGVQPVVFVTVPVLTLLGGDGPGELDGYGPIDPDTARRLAAHAPGFIRILTHPETGTVLSVGRDRYRVPKDLRNTILVRDKTCRHPGCNRPAPVCDIDHTIPWHQGGTTSYDNLAALCKRHHMLKTEGYWRYEQPEPGTITATSLTGKSYTTLPQPPPF
ncbi:HNH endonuclease [Arthrobacter sp. CAN_A1]|uniref:HNH endonuclease n=1 Tax=Arthrobacter sp. CAN_A1 TaxID=2787717 RepID=UPI001A30F134